MPAEDKVCVLCVGCKGAFYGFGVTSGESVRCPACGAVNEVPASTRNLIDGAEPLVESED